MKGALILVFWAAAIHAAEMTPSDQSIETRPADNAEPSQDINVKADQLQDANVKTESLQDANVKADPLQIEESHEVKPTQTERSLSPTLNAKTTNEVKVEGPKEVKAERVSGAYPSQAERDNQLYYIVRDPQVQLLAVLVALTLVPGKGALFMAMVAWLWSWLSFLWSWFSSPWIFIPWITVGVSAMVFAEGQEIMEDIIEPQLERLAQWRQARRH